MTIDVPADGPANAAAATAMVDLSGMDGDVVPLDALVAHGADSADAVPHDATAVALAYDLFEGQGAIEDVLNHYLAAQLPAEPTDVSETVRPEMMVNASLPAVVDPLDYLVATPDHDRHEIVSNYVG